jgi:hypothetical protein
VAQSNWTYLSESGQVYVVGLYHGPETGHVVVYCNNNVVAIDFNVVAESRYSFFIEEDMCEVVIRPRRKTYEYLFSSNRNVDTPFNRSRRARSRQERRWLMAFGAGTVLLITVMSVFFIRLDRKSDQGALLEGQGVHTLGRIWQDKDKRRILYSYAADGLVYHRVAEVPKTGILPNGMPLEMGDEFEVAYFPGKAKRGIINFMKPSPRQLELYRQRTALQHKALHPELSISSIACLLELAYALKGIHGIADFYWQEARTETHPAHNRLTYIQLISEEQFVRLKQKQCP